MEMSLARNAQMSIFLNMVSESGLLVDRWLSTDDQGAVLILRHAKN